MAQQEYSPYAAQPYQAPALPDPTPPVMPSPIPTNAPEANGAVQHTGAIATVADGLLRGVMAGRAYKQAADVMKFKKKDDNLQASYNADATRLYQLHQAGVDPNSDEFKQANAAVQGSWGALQDFRGQYINQQQKGKGSKKAQAAAQEPLIQRLHSPDPHVKTQALYELSQKAGPPVYGQIAMSAAQQKARAADPKVQAENLKSQNELTHQQLTQQRDTLLAIPSGQRTKEQNDQLATIDERLTGPAKPAAAPKPGDEAKRALDDVFKKVEADPNYKLTDQDKTILEANKMPIGPKSKITVTREGEIISDNGDGTFKLLRGPQGAYEAHGRGGRGGSGKPRMGTVGEFSTVEKQTSDAYAKAKAAYTKATTDIDTWTGTDGKPLSKEARDKAKQKASDDLQAEFKRIGELNSRRTRALGGIPAEDSGRSREDESEDESEEEEPEHEEAQPVQGHKPPKGASAPVNDHSGKLIGWVVDGEYQPLKQ